MESRRAPVAIVKAGDAADHAFAIQGSDGVVVRSAYPAEDPNLALLEYGGLVRNKRDGGGYRQRYLAVVAVADGRVTLFREYWHPLPLVASFGLAGPVPASGPWGGAACRVS